MFKGKQIKSIKLFRDKEKISWTHSSLIVDKIIDLIAPGNSLHPIIYSYYKLKANAYSI